MYAHTDVVFAKVEALNSEEHDHLLFVWPDEGIYTHEGWSFYADQKELEPLLVDAFTKSLLKQYYTRLNKGNKDKFKMLVETNRIFFMTLIEKIFDFIHKP